MCIKAAACAEFWGEIGAQLKGNPESSFETWTPSANNLTKKRLTPFIEQEVMVADVFVQVVMINVLSVSMGKDRAPSSGGAGASALVTEITPKLMSGRRRVLH